ncbi:hypothetical protein WME95_03690 [Sorangium sp. So ce327]|uniref:hypothetical protein n=1 Tax=Sorangium sp. So ce327 TaxID=3133301 RepID=UPI003F5FE45B
MMVDYIVEDMAYRLEELVGNSELKCEHLTGHVMAQLLSIQLKEILHGSDELFREVARRRQNSGRRGLQEAFGVAALQELRVKHSWIVELPADQVIAAQRTMIHVEMLYRLTRLFVPCRLVDEEFADAIEVVANHFKRSAVRWPAYIKLASATFWLMVHAFGYAASKLRISRSSAE